MLVIISLKCRIVALQIHRHFSFTLLFTYSLFSRLVLILQIFFIGQVAFGIIAHLQQCGAAPYPEVVGCSTAGSFLSNYLPQLVDRI